MQKLKELLKKQLDKIKPTEQEVKEIDRKIKKVIDSLNKNIKKQKIKADIFIGGSSAKNTLIKKKKYDIDLFVRFDKQYDEKKISSMLRKLIPKKIKAKVMKGSRDYYSLSEDGLEFEVVPVLKISSPKQARNITDLSYSHVNYVKNKIKAKSKLADEIRLAKAFTYYQDCYGAESYINGFSGYALELLIIYYKSFLNFIKAMTKVKMSQKEIIDLAKSYKNKEQLKEEMNKSKILSPIILVDPTFKERNALAALSSQTFARFQKACKRFLAKPSSKFFELEDKEQKLEKKYGKRLMKLRITTNKQAGDIAGTKLKKFYRYFIREMGKFFDIKTSDFDYDEQKNIGIIFFVANPKKQIIIPGPPVKMKQAAIEFKKKHKKVKISKNKLYAVQLLDMTVNKFLKIFKKAKKRCILEMSVKFID